MTGNPKIKTLLLTEDENENRRGQTMMNRRPFISPGSLGFVEGSVDLGSLQSDSLQDSYEDSRAELDAMGHNLTSVLMNPRETAMESLLDEFATKQTQSLQVTSSSSSSSSSTTSSFSSSSIMDISMSMSSMHSNSSSTHSMSASAHGAMASLSLFATTSSDMDQLKDLLVQMKRIYREYNTLQQHHLRQQQQQVPKPLSQHPLGGGPGHDPGKSSSSSSSSSSYHLVLPPSAEDVALCFREVPEVFFKSDFSLTSPEVFAQTLMGGSDKASAATSQLLTQLKHQQPPSSSSSSSVGGCSGSTHSNHHQQQLCHINAQYQPQQERLSRYLDLVEMALLKHIWSRSPAFFRALDDIKGLQGQVAQASACLTRLRSKVQALDNEVALGALCIPQMHCRQRNECALSDKIACIQRVVESRASIQYLLEVEDYLGALEVIHECRTLFVEEGLGGLSCVRATGRQLDEYYEFVCEILTNKFVSLAVQWDDQDIDDEGGEGEEDGNEAAVAGDANDDDDLLATSAAIMRRRQKKQTSSSSSSSTGPVPSLSSSSESSVALEQLLLALLKCDRLPSALHMYKQRLSDAVKLVVRTCVQEYLGGPGGAGDVDYLAVASIHPFDHANNEPSASSSSSTSDGQQQDGSLPVPPFAQRVKEMSHDSFLSCLSMSYEHLLLALHRAQRVEKFIVVALQRTSNNKNDSINDRSRESDDAVASSSSAASMHNDENVAGVAINAVADPPPDATTTTSSSSSTSSSNLSSVVNLSKSCLLAACDLGQRSVAQLLGLRRDANARMGLEKMKFLWETSLHFVLTLEGFSCSTAYVIRQCLLTQTRAFLDHMHETMKGKLVNTLDTERWTQCDVSTQRQSDIDRLASGNAFVNASNNMTTPEANAGAGVASNPDTAAAVPSSSSTAATGAVDSLAVGSDGSPSIPTSTASSSTMKSKKELKSVLVDGASFKVVWSSLLLTEVVLGYLEISFSFAPVTTDVIVKAVELMKLFDTRTKQLVLGAQAIQSAARLKSISAKHLAVTAQSIGLLVALLPHLRAALLAQLPPKHHIQLMELDRVSHTLIDHHGQIVAKFVSIVGDFVDHSSARLRTVDWDNINTNNNNSDGSCSSEGVNPLPAGQQQQSIDYFEEIQRNINALHRVLIETLPPEQVQDVFSRIFALLNRRIPLHFEDIMPATQTGRQRILDEVTHLTGAFVRLKLLDASAATAALEQTFRRRYGGQVTNNNSCSVVTTATITAV